MGCDEVVAIIRVRSVTSPAREFAEDDFAGLLAHERMVLTKMGYALTSQALWTRDGVDANDFDFWAVKQVGGQSRWTRVARYETRSGAIVRDSGQTETRVMH